ncbi:MAG: hypothetical protein AB8B63_16520 [Granulosicoccus sp.]
MITVRHFKRAYSKTALALLFASTATALLQFAAPSATAQEFQCELPGDTRYITVNIPGEEHLCDVTVKYDYSNETKRLWYAQNDSSFCSSRAYELRDKYINEWKYTCTSWPDRNGVDALSESQRIIFDRQLKGLIERGESASEPFRVTGTRAIASSASDNAPPLLAFQFFLDTRPDVTEIIAENDQSWSLVTELEDLKSRLDSDTPLASALIHEISSTGALKVHTTLFDNGEEECLGSQILSISALGDIAVKTPHHVICYQKVSKQTGEG